MSSFVVFLSRVTKVSPSGRTTTTRLGTSTVVLSTTWMAALVVDELRRAELNGQGPRGAAVHGSNPSGTGISGRRRTDQDRDQW